MKRLDSLHPADIRAECFDGGMPYLRFEPDAQELFNVWRADLERKVRSGEEHPALESHLAEYRSLVPSLALLIALAGRQRSGSHVHRTVAFICEVCKSAGFVAANDITADGMNRVMAAMKEKGSAPRTVQARVVAAKAFTNWLADHGKLAHDPLRSVKRPSLKADRRLRRRMLSPTEWPYLRAAALKCGPRDGMSSTERFALYAVAIQTGLRSSELRSLSKADSFLAGDKPHVRCRAENTNNGEVARQYIQSDLAQEVRQIVATKTPTANVFPMPDEWHAADMLRGDLAEARKEWLDEQKHDPSARAKREESAFLDVANHEGEVLDFHSLRHTCGSWLALQGVHPNVIKTIIRHSTITLTMDTYGHLLPDQHADAVDAMAKMLTDPVPRGATGTVGQAPAVRSAVGMPSSCSDGATACEAVRNEDDGRAPDEERKPLRIANCERVRINAR